jgi:hypothetical protein
MFAFATDFLGYSEAEALIRIQAARLTQDVPEVTGKIRSGELSLSVAASAHSHFRKENLRRKEKGQIVLSVQEKQEALDLLAGASRRKAEQSLNIHFAQPSARTLGFSASPELEQVRCIQKPEDSHPAGADLQEENAAEHRRGVRNRNRYIPRKTRRLVWAKYKGECNYKDPLSGKKCESKHAVQVDHKLALAKGGDHRPENLTLLCSGHNSWKGARQVE